MVTPGTNDLPAIIQIPEPVNYTEIPQSFWTPLWGEGHVANPVEYIKSDGA